MRYPFNRQIIKTCAGATDLKFYSDYVDPRQIIELRQLACSHTNILTTDPQFFFIEDGGNELIFKEAIVTINAGYAVWNGKIVLRPGQRVGVYSPNIATNEIITFNIIGVADDLKFWEKRG